MLARVCAQDLDDATNDPAKDELPIVSRGYYALPDDQDRAQINQPFSFEPPSGKASPYTDRQLDPLASQRVPGREQRARSRSRRRQGEENKKETRGRATSREARQRRIGPEATASDSDAPPKAKTQKLGQSAAGKGEPPPKASEPI